MEIKELEEAAENESEYLADWEDKSMYVRGFVDGAKWQAERMYSEEEVLGLLWKREWSYEYSMPFITVDEWFKQNKKK